VVGEIGEALETGFDAEILDLWSESLNEKIYQGYLVGTTQKSSVYRLFGQNHRYIAKLTQDKESINRDVIVNQYLDTEGILLGARPMMAGFGEHLQKSYIVFGDDRLQNTAKGEYFVGEAMEILLNLHQVNRIEPVRQLNQLNQNRNQLTPLQWTGRPELPAECRSHTPDFQEIVQVACSLDVQALEQSMSEQYVSLVTRKSIMQLFSFLQSVNLARLQASKVLCHGDAHPGNFLWSWKKRNWFLIDWEFLHMDSPYFDLFQFIDATSPHGRLQNRVSRRMVLMAYIKGNPQLRQNQSMMRGWLRGYLIYAAFHLFWIVQMIWYDLEQNRFASWQLKRQLAETFNRLAGVERDLYRK
jgi:hypothetical protein